MIGLDTNVLVRYLMQDDPRQSSRVNRLIEALTPDTPAFLTLVSLVELVWVLESAYGLKRQAVADALDGILRTREFRLDRADLVWRATRAYRSGPADFSDALIRYISETAGCESVLTFDRAAAKSGMTLIPAQDRAE